MSDKKALVVGINKYPHRPLPSCVNDAQCIKKLLENNEDGSENFDIKLMTDYQCKRANLRRAIRNLFANNDDIALLYFSGHGIDDEDDGFLVSQDYEEDDWGISMAEIMRYVNRSKCKNKILIFDCCNSGNAGRLGMVGDETILGEGTIIFTACRKDENAIVKYKDKNSLFTKLFLQALEGAASDVFGNTSPSSIYAFIDKALGAWEQRPIFKSNVSTFISLRKNAPSVTVKNLLATLNLFSKKSTKLRLNPSYEKTNYKHSTDRNHRPYKKMKNCGKMDLLQMCNRVGIVVPCEEKNMYETAMQSKHCELTKLGKYYYDLAKEGKIKET